MEAVGQLTGGIAHDFNNLLMVISGGLSVLDRNPPPERLQKLRDGMRQAAERGAALTRQLLAFSRQKELYPKAIAIPRYVDGMRELLNGSLAGDVAVETVFESGVWLGIDLPVVLVSGHADAIKRHTEKAGIPLLAKPYRLEELSATLRSARSRHAAAPTAGTSHAR